MKRFLVAPLFLAIVGVAARAQAEENPADAAKRIQSTNNLKQIALAMLNYESAYRTYPPAYIASKDGKPLLSWRVTILPYLEENTLYKQFHLDEPWDSEHNKALIAKMPQVHAAPGSKATKEFKTVYLVPRGDKTIFPDGTTIGARDITDGTSLTILAVTWTKPDDYQFDFDKPVEASDDRVSPSVYSRRSAAVTLAADKLTSRQGRLRGGLTCSSVEQISDVLRPTLRDPQ